MDKLFEARAEVLACRAKQALVEKEIELEKLKQPSKPWVGLTDEEIDNLWNQHEPRFDYYSFSCDLEAKLKEKNT